MQHKEFCGTAPFFQYCNFRHSFSLLVISVQMLICISIHVKSYMLKFHYWWQSDMAGLYVVTKKMKMLAKIPTFNSFNRVSFWLCVTKWQTGCTYSTTPMFKTFTVLNIRFSFTHTPIGGIPLTFIHCCCQQMYCFFCRAIVDCKKYV